MKQDFRQIYDAHAADILRFLVRRVDEPEDAADVLSEVFLVLWRRQPDLPDDEVRLWLYGVAHKALANHRRGQRRRGLLMAELKTALREANAVEPDVRDRKLGAALERLRAGDREVLLLASWEGLSSAQIARVLGVRPGTVRVRLHRARQRLHSIFRDQQQDIGCEIAFDPS